MKITVRVQEPATVPGGLLALACPEDACVSGWAFPDVDAALGGLLGNLAVAEGFTGKDGQTLNLHTHGKIGPDRVVLFGLGKEERPEALRLALAGAVRLALDTRQQTLAFVVPPLAGEVSPLLVQSLAEAVLLAAYRFDRYKKEPKERQLAEAVFLLPPATASGSVDALAAAVARGELLATSVCFARDLVNEPAGRLTPAVFASQAMELARCNGLEARVLDARQCAELGMGCLTGVGAGSENGPRLIHLTYRPEVEPLRSVALVGKGITFDSGGLNIKTSQGMEDMKGDMGGAAAVLGALRAIASLRPPLLVHAIVPAAENMPSGHALRPGDVLHALDGTSVEVRNTDAEGRLILGDAIAYAARLPVDEILELSTLTGACVVALGPHCAGLMSDDERLAADLLAAAQRSGEKLWRLPLARELHKEIEGDITDLKNAGSREGGAIQAGLFVSHFAGKTPFAHLDIAGPAMAEKDGPLSRKGGTGFGIDLLVEYLVPQSVLA